MLTARTLKNGLQVCHLACDGGGVGIGLSVAVGSRNDPSGKRGLSHVLEHMLLNWQTSLDRLESGSPLRPAASQAHGYVGREVSAYGLVVPYEQAACGLTWLRQVVFHPVLEQPTLAHELEVITTEAGDAMVYNPWMPVQHREDFDSISFGDEDLADPMIGDKRSRSKIRLEDIRSHHATFYVPGNGLLVLTSQSDPGELLDLAEQAFGDLEGGVVPPQPGPRGRTRWVGNTFRGHADYQGKSAQMNLAVLFAGWADPDWSTAALLHGALQHHAYQTLTNELGLTYSPQTAFEAGQHWGRLLLTTSTQPKYSQKLKEAVTAIADRLARQGFSADEWVSIRDVIKDRWQRHASARERLRSGLWYGRGWLHHPHAARPWALDEIRLEDLNRRIASLFAADRRILYYRPSNVASNIVGWVVGLIVLAYAIPALGLQVWGVLVIWQQWLFGLVR